MDHLKAMIIKFVATLALLYIILGIGFDVSFSNVLLTTIILGVISYLVGDLFLLRRTNNTVATLADFGLAFVVIWVILDNISTNDTNVFWATLISSIAVAVYEYFFHKYMVTSVFDENETNANGQSGALQYQTEASEEIQPDIPRRDDNI